MVSKSTIYRKAKGPVLCKKDKDGKVTEFTIEEDRWAYVDCKNQYPNGDSMLLNSGGAMCCLGFYSRACGISPIHLFEKISPYSIRKRLIPEMDWLIKYSDNSLECTDLMYENDNESQCSFSLRKRHIQKIFKQQGIKVKFVKSLHEVK